MIVNIDEKSGFCFGVVNAIEKAEQELEKSKKLYSLGHIVHNNAEVERLKARGLESINHEQLKQLRDCTVLIRAHGEPPSTYEIARNNNITLIDASCPVVLKLQSRIKQAYEKTAETDEQLVIFGEPGHAEVNGLVGQTNGKAIVIKKKEEINKIDLNKPVVLFSQTTMSIEGFVDLGATLKTKMEETQGTDNIGLSVKDTICRQVSNRTPQLKEFSKKHDIVLFVSGKESSNGKYLFEICKSVNPKSFFITEPNDIHAEWFKGIKAVGVCGATSTPRWQMEEVAKIATELSGSFSS
jgi:4-hydroxy-3-methylbut-2-enyl diphosphate reductase